MENDFLEYSPGFEPATFGPLCYPLKPATQSIQDQASFWLYWRSGFLGTSQRLLYPLR